MAWGLLLTGLVRPPQEVLQSVAGNKSGRTAQEGHHASWGPGPGLTGLTAEQNLATVV
jgi:hypothetical protein